MTASPSPSRPLTGRQVVLGFVVFFGVLIVAQVAFIVIAVSTHTGIVSKQPYRKGLNYGERIAQSEKQKELGWKESISLSEKQDRLILHIENKQSAPVSGLNLSGILSRPVHKNEDLTLEFREDSPGAYGADLSRANLGSFVVDVAATKDTSSDDVVWRTRRRIWIKP